jgi:hypothetical protein
MSHLGSDDGMMGDPEKKRKENEKSEARRIRLNRFIRVEVLVIRLRLANVNIFHD